MKRAAAALVAVLSVARGAAAQEASCEPGRACRGNQVEPWSDPDPPGAPPRQELGKDYGFRGAAEYRAMWLYVNPISLNTETDRRVSWIEHRLRLDASLDWRDQVRLVVSSDVLDGALWGDNGTYGGDPSSNSGLHVAAKNPNAAAPCIVQRGTDPLDSHSYGYGLCSANEITFRRVYGDVVTPVGLIRVGRQPVNVGTGVQNADGDGRPNRFGISRQGNSVDRILFATKPLEAFKPEAERDRSAEHGFFFITGYDRYVTGDPQLFADDVHQAFWSFRYLEPDWALGRDLFVAGYQVYRWDETYRSRIQSYGLRALSRFGAFYAGFDAAANIGSTREISTAYSLLTSDPVVDQTVRAIGGRAVVRYDQPTWTAYVEADYASGNSHPQPRLPLTQFTFAEDTNVGLLLFEHVLAFQTARSSAAGVATLKQLGATTFPAEAIATHGAFTNAFALFPQVDLKPHPAILLRGGALFAWAAEPVTDPIATLKVKEGNATAENVYNFAGGKPASYYGTELDGRFQWRYVDHFLFDLEGAILFPGKALADRDGNAVRSVLVQGRTTFVF